MALTHAYFVLLALVGLGRLIELSISRRHQRALQNRSAELVSEPGFRWMVLLHCGILLGAGLEVELLHRPLLAAVALPALLVFLAANALRWWVIRSMATHWNVRVVDSLGLGIVERGPFRLLRHPNYSAVFLELAALPLIHGAWLTALLGGALHALVLRRRVRLEERVLFGHLAYRQSFQHKPRFVPRIADLEALFEPAPPAANTFLAASRARGKDQRPS
jgi:methyltransferase